MAVPIDGGYLLLEDGRWRYELMRQLNGWRLMERHDSQQTYGRAWCFPSREAAVLAVMVWDPGTQQDPSGFSRKIGPQLRPDE